MASPFGWAATPTACKRSSGLMYPVLPNRFCRYRLRVSQRISVRGLMWLRFPLELRGKGIDMLVSGSASRLADGRFDIRYRLSDLIKQRAMFQRSLVVHPDDLRMAGHRIADEIFEALTGEKGIFSTRIAYVSKQATRYVLQIADWDAENPQLALSSAEPIISPRWSPDGTKLAYVSFESKKPVVYVHNLATGERLAVANFRGSNSAPAWSPDGQELAVALTLDGMSQIYRVSVRGGSPSRVTSSNAIDTEPVFSPDGRSIYFTSDRAGSPQIYQVPSQGGEAKRVSFGSPYSTSARLSPDGKLLAYITRREGRYLVAVRDLATGDDSLISEGGREEAPSFSPNGKWVMYASRRGGRDALIAASVDGKVKQQLASLAGDMREPAWGPLPLK
ncbi:MAG: Tol-Pal system protein TolB [Betaproteobacteria bacterium]|nr:Tol-Pal system protein TolB [Betaproteobacteria bacterium]